jgi:23S rRNA (adenine2503-C2)-methyltransferase
MTIPILQLTCNELSAELGLRFDKGTFHARAIYREIFKNGNRSFTNAPEFAQSGNFSKQLMQEISVPVFAITSVQEDCVCKFATKLDDSAIIESVIIPGPKRTTLCVSSQAGCKMGCTFCATGRRGFQRNCSVEEIVAQVFISTFTFKRPVDNIVFMGMGEPLDNFSNVMQAIYVMSDQRGFDIPQSRITISTAGHCDGIFALANIRYAKIRLAVSLNASNDGLRNALMPINKRFPLARLKEQLRRFPLGKRGIIFIEYVLFEGLNDSREAAQELADFVTGLAVRINLIPYNQTSGNNFASPTHNRVKRFASWLAEHKLFVRIRQSYGRGICAACGQLRAEAK